MTPISAIGLSGFTPSNTRKYVPPATEPTRGVNESTTGGGAPLKSSLTILQTAYGRATPAAGSAAVRLTRNASSDSTSVSPLICTVKVFVVSPALNLTVPFAAT